MEIGMFDFVKTLLRRPSIRDRRFERIMIQARAELFFTERRYGINGMVIEMSQRGALFREASEYIMDRKGALVIVRIAREEFPGVIVNVRPTGYGILFDGPVSEDTIAELAMLSAESVE